MKRTYVYQDGKMVEKLQSPPKEKLHYVQDDIKPYKSMADGSIISSRSQHRRHLKRHGCIEIGNEKMETKVQAPKDTRRDVLRSQLANMTHAQANQILTRLRDDARFTNNPHRKN
jgi:hypothetical protein